MFIATPYNDDGADLVNYKLSGAYNDLVYYYNMYSCYITQTNTPGGVKSYYVDKVNMNSILYSIYRYCDNIVLNSICLDDTSAWVDNPLKISVDFCETEEKYFEYISVRCNAKEKDIKIYEYNNFPK